MMRSLATVGCVLLLVWAVFMSHDYDPTCYRHQDYVADTNWCLQHDMQYRSEGIDQPVTCLRAGVDAAIPPNSLNLATIKEQK